MGSAARVDSAVNAVRVRTPDDNLREPVLTQAESNGCRETQLHGIIDWELQVKLEKCLDPGPLILVSRLFGSLEMVRARNLRHSVRSPCVR